MSNMKRRKMAARFSWYSDEALRKQAIPSGQFKWTDMLGIFEPRRPARPEERCSCGADARPRGAYPGDGTWCYLCLSRGYDE